MLTIQKTKPFKLSTTHQIAKNTIVLYFRQILTMIVSLYTSRVILQVLGIEDFGIYSVVGGIVVMFGVLNSAMSTATQRYLSYELGRNNKGQLKKVFSTSVIIHLIIGGIILVLAETIGLWFVNNLLSLPADRLYAANWVYQLSVFTFIINVLSVPYNAAIVAHEKMNVYAYVSIADSFLKLLVVWILFYVCADKLILFSVFVFLISLFIRVFYQIYSKRKFAECTFNFVWDKDLLKSILQFSGWSLFGGGAYIAKIQGVSFLLNIFFGAVINAAWGIAQQVNMAILTLVQNFTTAINPPIIKSHASCDNARTQYLLFNGIKYSFLLGFIFIVPLFFETDYVLSLWLKKVPAYTNLFVRLFLVIILIESSSHVIGTTVQAVGRIKWYQILIGSTLFLNLPLSYIALRYSVNPISVMYIGVILSALSMILRFIILYNLIRFSVQQLLKTIFFLSIISLIIIPIVACLQLLNESFLRVLLTSFSTLFLTAIALWFLGMTNAERVKIVNLVKEKYSIKANL